MAVHIDGIFDKKTSEKIINTKLLVVGAGGIGCELLKNLVLSGFENLHVIDLDTIELSNLNRQFLFHKQHVGKPKAIVAKESVLKFNPKAQISAYHDSITNPSYGVEFFQQFSAVLNALDNVAARSHVNRMCLAADIPLIESGTAGYVGQVTVYKKKLTECFECLPRKGQKTYPGCTIRNTPSEPVHCIVWAKHLFNQLFGETDADEEVSPDTADPELNEAPTEDGNVIRKSTREWAKMSDYHPEKIFNKLFGEDIDYLNRMNDLWQKRRRPQRLDFNNLPDAVPGPSQQATPQIKDQMLWSIKQCAQKFTESLEKLKNRLNSTPDNILTWDKDDDDAMDFVASVANLRSHCFFIGQKSRFDIKAIAGNIIPAIATTNAVIAGLIVLQVIKILKGDITKCKTVWLKEAVVGGKILSASQLEKPNPKCLVCSTETPEVSVKVNWNTLSLRTLNDKILKEKLHMTQPDVMVNDGKGNILISSDPDEIEDHMLDKVLKDFNIDVCNRLICEDFLQHYKINLVVCNNPELKDQEFDMVVDIDSLLSKQEPEKKNEHTNNEVKTIGDNEIEMLSDDEVVITEKRSEISKQVNVTNENSRDEVKGAESKRKLSNDENGVEQSVSKKMKTVA